MSEWPDQQQLDGVCATVTERWIQINQCITMKLTLLRKLELSCSRVCSDEQMSVTVARVQRVHMADGRSRLCVSGCRSLVCFVLTQLYSQSSWRVYVETGVPASAAGDEHTNTPAPANTQSGQLQETAARRQKQENPAAAGGTTPPRRCTNQAFFSFERISEPMFR